MEDPRSRCAKLKLTDCAEVMLASKGNCIAILAKITDARSLVSINRSGKVPIKSLECNKLVQNLVK